MLGEKLSVDELTGRGLEDIHDSIDLMGVFSTVIRTLPNNSTKGAVLMAFDHAWAECRDD